MSDKSSGPRHLYRVTRLDPVDGPSRLDGSDGAVVLDVNTGIPGLMMWAAFGIVGTYDEETAERVIVQMYERLEWGPATYRLEVFPAYRFDAKTSKPFVTVTRELPLPESYAALPTTPKPGDPRPARVYVMRTLMRLYPGATLRQLGDHVVAFADHHRVEIGTAELTRVSGWTPPQGWTRPNSPYSQYNTLDEVPAHLL